MKRREEEGRRWRALAMSESEGIFCVGYVWLVV